MFDFTRFGVAGLILARPFKAAANPWHGGWATCRRVVARLWVGVGVVLAAGAPQASAQVYNWVPWTSTGGQTAAATDPVMGTVTLGSDNGTGVSVPFPVRFDGVSFTPADAPSVGIGNGVLNGWTLTISFAAVPNTTGVIVGIGNFGHGTPSLPGYRLAAFDTLGLAMPLTTLEQIGSYDHTWTASNIPFNDDVTLNTESGDFVVTAVAGLNENNSDILLMSLPAGVGRLEVSTVGPTAAETINLLIATPGPAGDLDSDGDVDLVDYAAFAECLFGPDVAPSPAPPITADECLGYFDFDSDDDVDLGDGQAFQAAFTGV